ncbi:MAG: GNAT family N-acetyltransferase [Prevotellaceae bacterium]|jgi:ribosomal protein S18 acetylase RimI-like enzyme|nr:GNAT family N-acetyltransferase [Prevotellaceae bacterium]
MIEYGTLKDDELPELLELYKQLNPNDDAASEAAAKNIWADIKRQNIQYFVARKDGKILASCYLCIIPNLTRGGSAIGFIENVITDAAHRRMGLGKNVMQNAIAHAKKQGCYKVVLQSGNNRAEAHEFYAALGFDGTSKKAFEMRW